MLERRCLKPEMLDVVKPRAVIVGLTGIGGNTLADQLIADGWTVAGSERVAVSHPAGLRPAPGFLDYQSTLHSFIDLLDRLRRERLIP